MLPHFIRRLFGAAPRAADIPDQLWHDAIEKHPICHNLSAEQQAQLRNRTGEILARLYFEFVRGVPENDGLKLSVALQAALPVLQLGVHWYRSVRTIVLVPHEYEIEQSVVDEAGVIHEGTDTISGELGHQGPVVLSVPDVEASGWGEGYNVVIHEMTHVLDATNGDLDGAPAFPPGLSSEAWTTAMSEAYNDHIRRVERAERSAAAPRTSGNRNRGAAGRGEDADAGAKHGRHHPAVHGHRRLPKPPVLDPYAAEGAEEFFACAAELFFERPGRLRRAYPAVHEQFLAFFGFDPAGSVTPAANQPDPAGS